MSIYEEARGNYDRFYQQGKRHGYEQGLRAGKEQANAWPSFISELLNGASYLFMIAGFAYFIYTMGQFSAVTELAKLKIEERERQKVEKTIASWALQTGGYIEEGATDRQHQATIERLEKQLAAIDARLGIKSETMEIRAK
jgi:flagellar biosynthesis/type III secretory pathway protein FliH